MTKATTLIAIAAALLIAAGTANGQGVEAQQAKAEQGDAEAQYELGAAYYHGEGVEQDRVLGLHWWRQAAEQGHARAQYGLGEAYGTGRGVLYSQVIASEWFRKAAEQGHAEAQYRLSMFYEDGLGVEQDQEQAVHWLRKAAEQGHAEAQYRLARAERDREQSVHWYRKAAEQGHAEAQYWLGYAYGIGNGVEENDTQAYIWYSLSGANGENVGRMLQFMSERMTPTEVARAQLALGHAYAGGKAVEADMAQAVHWYRKAAEQGDAEAQSMLAKAYLSGEGVKQDFTQAYIWLSLLSKAEGQVTEETLENLRRRMTPAEVARAQELATQRFEEIEAQAEQNRAAAAKAKAEQNQAAAAKAKAEQGDARAQFSLGEAYRHGEGVEEDDEQAAHWYRQAAEQGHAEAQYMLGLAYRFGQGVEQDHEQAVHWYRKAAEQGDADAQFRMGSAYGLGEGVELDLTVSYAWFILAKAGGADVTGRAEFTETLGRLREFLTPAQVEAAQELALEIQNRIEARKAEQEE